VAIRRVTPHLSQPYLPISGTCRTILIDTPAQALYTRAEDPSTV
jgi:hypothetical protein